MKKYLLATAMLIFALIPSSAQAQMFACPPGVEHLPGTGLCMTPQTQQQRDLAQQRQQQQQQAQQEKATALAKAQAEIEKLPPTSAEDQTRLYAELVELQHQYATVSNDQNLTSLQQSDRLQQIVSEAQQFAKITKVKDWECEVVDVLSTVIGPSPRPNGTKWVLACKYKDLTFGLYFSGDDARLSNLQKGSVVHFDAHVNRQFCQWAMVVGDSCTDQSFPTRFEVQDIR